MNIHSAVLSVREKDTESLQYALRSLLGKSNLRCLQKARCVVKSGIVFFISFVLKYHSAAEAEDRSIL